MKSLASHLSTQCSYCGFDHEAGLNFCPTTGKPLGSNGNLVGSVLEGKYRLIRHLDHDGLFSIYQADHEVIGRRQVVYVAPAAASAEETFIERVLASLRQAAKLGHENLVELNDMGRDPVLGPYAVFEWIAGESLGTWLGKHAPLHPGHAIMLFSQILSALEMAHERALVHGNLTPESVILLDGPGTRVKVRGLGVFHPDNPGPGDDLRQVGAMLYLALTGIPLQGDAPHRPSASRPQLSLMLDEAVMRALGEELAEGPWASARQMREALEWAAKAGGPADPTTPPVMISSGPTLMYAAAAPQQPAAPSLLVEVPPVMPAPVPQAAAPMPQRAVATPLAAPPTPAPLSAENTGEAQFWNSRPEATIYTSDDLVDEWAPVKRSKSSVLVVSLLLGCALFVGLAYMVSRRSDTRAAGGSEFAAPVRPPESNPPPPVPSVPAVPAPEPVGAAAPVAAAAPAVVAGSEAQAAAPAQPALVVPEAAPAPVAAAPAAPAIVPLKENHDATVRTGTLRTSRSAERAVAAARNKAIGEISKPKAAPVTRRKIITDNPY